MPYESPELSTDPDEVSARILDNLAERLPGWEPVEGAPEVALALEIGRETAETNDRMVSVIALAFAAIGETVFGVAAHQATAAELSVRLGVTGPAAVVPAGLTVLGVTATGVEAAFELLEQATAAATIGTSTVDVTMVALDPGAAGNGVPAGELTVITATATVTGATALADSAGGIDDEPLADYLDRFADYASTLRPGGVRGADLAILARSVPGVHRALGIDLYDPATPGVPAERTATVVPIDIAGQPVDEATAAAVVELLQQAREVNFVIHLAEPTYTPVEVEYAAVVDPGADPAVVEADIAAAVAAYLSPATWGTTELDDEAWTGQNAVRYLDLARIIGTVSGVASMTALTIDGGTVDVTLLGVAPLPAAVGPDGSAVTGTLS